MRNSFLRWLLFAFALLLFLCALLVLCSAPTSILWIVAILIAEWGHYAALAALLIIALSWRQGRLGNITLLLALLAGLLCLTPALRASFIAHSLPARCADAFGAASHHAGRSVPFRALDLFRGVPISKVKVTEHVYANEGRKQLKLDLYQPANASAPRPIVIMVHGGSWKGGSKNQLPALNRYLAHEGYGVVALNYRHAPEWQFPAPVDDVFRAIEFLRIHAGEFGLDASRIVLIGRSAGAQIALTVACSGKEPAIRGVVDFYGPADLILGYEHPSRRWVLDSKKILEDYLGGPPNEKPAEYHAGSAVNFIGAETPPALLIHGQLDPIVWPEQSEHLEAHLAAAGRPHLYLSLPWATHGCDANISGPSGQLSLYAIDRFLAAVLPADSR